MILVVTVLLAIVVLIRTIISIVMIIAAFHIPNDTNGSYVSEASNDNLAGKHH